MDAIDRQILACLRENARQNATEIGGKISLSTSAVIERIRKMEASGLIRQYTVILDGQILGKDLVSFITVRLEHPKYYENFEEVIKKHRAIPESYYIAGDFDFMLKVVAGSTGELEEILNQIKSIAGVSQTRTTVVFSTNKREVSLLPEDAGSENKKY